jgi:hypothetical protein
MRCKRRRRRNCRRNKNMRLLTKFIWFNSTIIIFAGGLLLTGGCLSSPRDFSSPATTIKIVNENGAPLSNVEVSRHWDDSDCDTSGSETNMTDLTGIAKFPKIPANVGLFTGAWRKTHDNLAPRGSASGTSTTIQIRLAGIYDVMPKDGQLHEIKTAHDLYEDKDGVIFYTSADGMMTAITFPEKSKLIDYVVSAKTKSH